MRRTPTTRPARTSSGRDAHSVCGRGFEDEGTTTLSMEERVAGAGKECAASTAA